MNNTLIEGEFGHGSLGHLLRPTDWLYHNMVPKGTPPFDWSKGYDVEKEIGMNIPVKNQGSSGSCGGQAVASYAFVLKAIRDKSIAERSAKFIYAPIAQPGGGTYGGDLMARMKSTGVSTEILCPSYENGQPPSEAFMEDKSSISSLAMTDASTSLSANYSFLIQFDIDVLAQAIRDNHGIIIGIGGQNNGTWLTSNPLPPMSVEWRHWMYFGKSLMINGQKKIIGLNSWGTSVGNGGWQNFGEDYVNNGIELGMIMSFGIPTYQFNKDLFFGITDADVFFLQKKLNQNPQTMVATTGPGSLGNETYHFGNLTKQAVIKYQQLNNIAPAIGFVGRITRGILNQ